MGSEKVARGNRRGSQLCLSASAGRGVVQCLVSKAHVRTDRDGLKVTAVLGIVYSKLPDTQPAKTPQTQTVCVRHTDLGRTQTLTSLLLVLPWAWWVRCMAWWLLGHTNNLLLGYQGC